MTTLSLTLSTGLLVLFFSGHFIFADTLPDLNTKISNSKKEQIQRLSQLLRKNSKDILELYKKKNSGAINNKTFQKRYSQLDSRALKIIEKKEQLQKEIDNERQRLKQDNSEKSELESLQELLAEDLQLLHKMQTDVRNGEEVDYSLLRLYERRVASIRNEIRLLGGDPDQIENDINQELEGSAENRHRHSETNFSIPHTPNADLEVTERAYLETELIRLQTRLNEHLDARERSVAWNGSYDNILRELVQTQYLLADDYAGSISDEDRHRLHQVFVELGAVEQLLREEDAIHAELQPLRELMREVEGSFRANKTSPLSGPMASAYTELSRVVRDSQLLTAQKRNLVIQRLNSEVEPRVVAVFNSRIQRGVQNMNLQLTESWRQANLSDTPAPFRISEAPENNRALQRDIARLVRQQAYDRFGVRPFER